MCVLLILPHMVPPFYTNSYSPIALMGSCVPRWVWLWDHRDQAGQVMWLLWVSHGSWRIKWTASCSWPWVSYLTLGCFGFLSLHREAALGTQPDNTWKSVEPCFCLWELLRISVTRLVWWHELPGPTSFTETIMEAPQQPLCPQSQPEHCHQSSADHPLFISGHFCDSLIPREFTFF